MDGTATVEGRTLHGLAAAATLVALTGAFAYCYSDVVRLLVTVWWTKDFYSHGFLIPFIAGFLAWGRRDRLRAALGLGSLSYALGAAVLVTALVALQLGRTASFSLLQEVTLPVALAGVLLLAGGRRAARVAWLPVVYLYFAIPIWDVLTDNLQYPFRLMTATMGQRFMEIAGVPSLRIGTLLQLPEVSLEVASACSGVNYLISVIAVSVPYAYLTLTSNLRRAAVVVFAVAVAIVSNGVRVALIGVLQFYGWSSQKDLHGPAHTLQGMFVAVVGYAALFLGARLLEEKTAPGARHEEVSSPTAWRPSVPAVVTAVALLLAGGLVRPFAETVPTSVAGGDPFPQAVGRWTTQNVPGAAAISWSGADQSAAKFYSAEGLGTIQVYVGHLARQVPGRKLVGDGNLRVPSSVEPVTLRSPDGTDTSAAESDVRDDSVTQKKAITIYWYDLNGHRTTSDYWVKCLTVWNSLVRRQSNGAVVVVELTLDSSANPDAGRSALREFAGSIVPYTGRYLAPGTQQR